PMVQRITKRNAQENLAGTVGDFKLHLPYVMTIQMQIVYGPAGGANRRFPRGAEIGQCRDVAPFQPIIAPNAEDVSWHRLPSQVASFRRGTGVPTLRWGDRSGSCRPIAIRYDHSRKVQGQDAENRPWRAMKRLCGRMP